MTSITTEVSKDAGVKPRDAERSKNFFALGLISWLYTRPIEATVDLDRREVRRQAPGPGGQPPRLQGRLPLRRDGRAVRVLLRGEAGRARARRVRQRHRQHGHRLGADRRLAAAAACRCSSGPIRSPRRPTSSTSCPSTSSSACAPSRRRTRSPASAPPSAPPSGGRSGSPPPPVRASTSSRRPWAWPSASSCPLLIIDIQRGGPSTGLPTKTEQADLLHAMYGRHGEAPVPIVAARTPSHCFEATLEAVRIAVKYRTPVILLSDGYLANGAEPWRLPDLDDLPDHRPRFRHRAQPHRARRHRGVLALRPRRRDAGPPLGAARACPASSTASAASRRRTARATSPTTVPTTSG